MTKIVAKETGPAARRARKRSRRNGGGTSVETVDQNSEPIVDSKGKDRKASTKYPSNSQSTSKSTFHEPTIHLYCSEIDCTNLWT